MNNSRSFVCRENSITGETPAAPKLRRLGLLGCFALLLPCCDGNVIVLPPSVVITAPSDALIGETITLSAQSNRPGGTFQWSVVNRGEGTFSKPNSPETQLTIVDRSLAFDGDEGPNIAVLVDYTPDDGETTVSAIAQVTLSLDTALASFVKEISFTVVDDPDQVLPSPGQTVVFSAVIVPKEGSQVGEVVVEPATFEFPADTNDILLIPVTVSATIDGIAGVFTKQTKIAIPTNLFHLVSINSIRREFDRYCELFPNTEFCDVWTKAQEHLFGPGGSGIKSDNRKEGWIGWGWSKQDAMLLTKSPSLGRGSRDEAN